MKRILTYEDAEKALKRLARKYNIENPLYILSECGVMSEFDSLAWKILCEQMKKLCEKGKK
jgi:hypothetical protein